MIRHPVQVNAFVYPVDAILDAVLHRVSLSEIRKSRVAYGSRGYLRTTIEFLSLASLTTKQSPLEKARSQDDP